MQRVEIRVKGQIDPRWSEWFGGLVIHHCETSETILTGILPDESAVYGVIARLRDLGLMLNSMISQEILPPDSQLK